MAAAAEAAATRARSRENDLAIEKSTTEQVATEKRKSTAVQKMAREIFNDAAGVTNSKGGKGSSGSSSSIYESGKGGKGSSGKNKGGKGSSGSIYEIDEHTKVQCTKAEYKIEGDCWTRL